MPNSRRVPGNALLPGEAPKPAAEVAEKKVLVLQGRCAWRLSGWHV